MSKQDVTETIEEMYEEVETAQEEEDPDVYNSMALQTTANIDPSGILLYHLLYLILAFQQSFGD